MRVEDFEKRFSSVAGENRFNRLLVLALVAVLGIESFYLFQKETVVVMQPWTLNEHAELTSAKASRSYQESWALALAEMLGNLTPGNVDFVIERLKPLLSPKIYNDIIRNAQEQALYLKEDRITQSFEPRSVEYEKSTGKVFVKGYSFIAGSAMGSGADTKPIRNESTFEFKIRITNYMPVVEDIQVYAGAARTEKVIQQNEQKAKRKADQEAKRAAKDN